MCKGVRPWCSEGAETGGTRSCGWLSHRWRERRGRNGANDKTGTATTGVWWTNKKVHALFLQYRASKQNHRSIRSWYIVTDSKHSNSTLVFIQLSNISRRKVKSIQVFIHCCYGNIKIWFMEINSWWSDEMSWVCTDLISSQSSRDGKTKRICHFYYVLHVFMWRSLQSLHHSKASESGPRAERLSMYIHYDFNTNVDIVVTGWPEHCG